MPTHGGGKQRSVEAVLPRSNAVVAKRRAKLRSYVDETWRMQTTQSREWHVRFQTGRESVKYSQAKISEDSNMCDAIDSPGKLNT
jgi:hypothetical protein